MKLTELLRNECIQVGSTVDDKAMALCEIASLAKKCEALKKVSEEAILESLQEREIVGSTAFGHGIAIPHCRMKGIADFVVGLVTIPDGVEFDAEDGNKVNLIVFIIAPKDGGNTHIRLLSTISRALQDETVVSKMIESSDNETLRSVFLEATEEDVSERTPLRRNLVHVFVQDDKVFAEILETLSGLENVSLTVFDTQSGRSYLNQLPAKTDFSETSAIDSKCIVAIVERRLSNEVVRRIESVTGSLFECIGVMVTIKELSYSNGSLEM